MKKHIIILLTSFSFLSCVENPDSYIQYIEGYWEITDVTKNNKTVKSYTVNTNIDYFKVNDDLTGYRKKVTPTLDGKFTITQHESPFVIKIENNQLQIHYTVNNVTFKETIERASETELIISNVDGFRYTYQPFESIDLE